MANRSELFPALRQWASLSWHVMRPTAYPWRGENAGKPFFIVGSGRCGTTLLRRFLQASPQIHIPPENWAFAGWIHTFRRYRAVLRWHELVHLLFSKFMVSNHGWFERYPQDLLDELVALTYPDRNLAKFIDTRYSYHGRYCGAEFTRWGDKTPINVHHMVDILRVFPEAQFIFLLRDGVDVAYSMSFLEKYQGDVMQAAERWRRAFWEGQAFGTKYPDKLLVVRYEALVRNPIDSMSRIAPFLDVDYPPTLLGRDDLRGEMADAASTPHLRNVFRPVSTDSIGKGRRELGETQLRQLNRAIGDELVKAGYERPLADSR